MRHGAKIHKAIEFAVLKHAGQKRKGTNIPYIVHPMEVMQILSENGCKEDVIIAGLLHDTVEDAGVSIKEIHQIFGSVVANIVSFESEDKAKTWQERKQITLDNLADSDFDCSICCLADKLSNIRAIYSDYNNIGDKLWDRFNKDKESIGWYYKSIREITKRFEYHPIWKEYDKIVNKVFDKDIL